MLAPRHVFVCPEGQTEYLIKAGVAVPDVGGERKRFSINEARMVVIAGRCLAYGMAPRALVEPIGWLRDFSSWPEINGLPRNLPKLRLNCLPIASGVFQISP